MKFVEKDEKIIRKIARGMLGPLFQLTDLMRASESVNC